MSVSSVGVRGKFRSGKGTALVADSSVESLASPISERADAGDSLDGPMAIHFSTRKKPGSSAISEGPFAFEFLKDALALSAESVCFPRSNLGVSF